MVNIWTGYIGVFENKGSWIGNPNNIDLDDFSGFGNDYVDFNVKNYGGITDPDIRKKNIAALNTGFFGVRAVDKTLDFNAWIKDSATQISEEILSEIEDFIVQHSSVSDTKTYLVIRKWLDGAWHYKTTRDNDGNSGLKYIQGRLGAVRHKKMKYSRMDLTVQFHEGWLG